MNLEIHFRVLCNLAHHDNYVTYDNYDNYGNYDNQDNYDNCYLGGPGGRVAGLSWWENLQSTVSWGLRWGQGTLG